MNCTRTGLLLALAMGLAACQPGASPAPLTTPTSPTPTPTAPASTPTAQALELPAPYSLVSQERMFASLEDLTALQAYSGWRNSATEGEAEALEYVADTLSEFAHLQDLGLELERQSFPVFLATEIWESRLFHNYKGQHCY